MKEELVVKMQAIANGESFNAEEMNEVLFEELVPSMGKADTEGGEIMRAVNRIQYRYWNDGDIAGQGYGKRTVNPAVRFLDLVVFRLKSCAFRTLVNQFQDYVDGISVTDKEYEEKVNELVKEAIIYIAQKKLYEVSNGIDMLDCAFPEFDKEDDYEDEDDFFEEDSDE